MKRLISLTEEQQKVYKQMKEKALAELTWRKNDNRKCFNSTHEIATNYLWKL